MSRMLGAGGAPARFLSLVLGLLLVAVLGAGAVTVRAGAQGEPPERLSEEELLRQITAAPENAPDFQATVAVEQTLIPEGLIGASEGDGGSASGPRTARVWRGGPDTFRAELQGENGDKVSVKDGAEARVYDGATNTLKTGERPASEKPEGLQKAASPEEIDEFLAEISPTSDLETGRPVRAGGRWAYSLTLEPKDKDLTLVDRAEVLVDSEAFVPLSFELYAEDSPEPVVSYEARNFKVGPGPDERFDLEAPPGATVEPLDREDSARAEEANGEQASGERQEPRSVGSVAEAASLVGSPVSQLSEAPGGRELTEARVAGEGVVLTYGSGWGSVVLTQRPEGAEEPHETERSSREDEAGGDERRGQRQEIPTVNLGGGVEAREISTPIGTSLSWTEDGVSYSLTGSVPAAELEEAARGLASSS